MAIKIAHASFRRLDVAECQAWRDVPTTIASDVQNRSMTLPGAIRAMRPGVRLFGQARTVLPSPGDNACVLQLAGMLVAGEVLVVAGCGPDVAMAGELVARQCFKRGGGGIVVDGAMRDAEALQRIDLPVYCRGFVPRGPVKEFGGFIDMPVGIGGVAIAAGDLILGDADGITVVPLAIAGSVLRQCIHHMQLDDARAAAIERGESLAELFGVQPVEYLE